MATIRWFGKSGSWTTAADWVGGVVPSSSDDVIVGGSGTYMLSLASTVSAHSLTLDDADATIALDSGAALTIGTAFTLTEGTLQLNYGATINGGILSCTKGVYQWNDGTLNGVTYNGTLDLSAANSDIEVGGKGLSLTGAATINLTGEGSLLDFGGTQTINNARINLGTAANEYGFSAVLGATPINNGDILTLGPKLIINQSSIYADIGGLSEEGNEFGAAVGFGSITNNAAINAAVAAGEFMIDPQSFTNLGIITISNGDEVTIANPGQFDNGTTGVINIEAGSIISLGGATEAAQNILGAYANNGLIEGTNSTINLYASINGNGKFDFTNSNVNIFYNLTTEQLSAFEVGGNAISITGVVNNTDATLILSNGTISQNLKFDATIMGGTIVNASSGYNLLTYSPNGSGGAVTLDGVEFDGPLNFVSSDDSSLVISGQGLIAKGKGGAGNGTINVSGFMANVVFDDNQVVDNATINYTVTNYYESLIQKDVTTTNGLLTFGKGSVLNEIGYGGILNLSSGAVVNDGIINAEASVHSYFYLAPSTFTNNGTINVLNGDDLSFNSQLDTVSNFTNLSNGTLKGGTYNVEASSTLILPDNQSLTTNAATIILNGTGAVFENEATRTAAAQSLESTLKTIGTTGVLEIIGNRNYTTSNSLSNSGKIILGGGSLSVASIIDPVGSTLGGYGTVRGNFTDSGAVTASGSGLVFTGTSDSFAGGLGGGEIVFGGGDQALNAAATVTAAKWLIDGGATTAINEKLVYAGAFSLAAATLDVATGLVFNLSGVSRFATASLLTGAGVVNVTTSTISGLTLGGTDVLNALGAVVQTGALTLGDTSAKAVALSIRAGATWTLDGNVGIARGASVATRISDSGSLIKSAGTGVSAVGVVIADSGLIEAASGTLDLTQGVEGAGQLKIDAGATLELDAAAQKTLTIAFNGTGATLALGAAHGIAATLAGFSAGDIIELLNTSVTTATMGAGDTLSIKNGTKTVATLQLSGNFAGDAFAVASDGHGGSNITLTAPGAARTNGVFIQRMATFGVNNSAASSPESGVAAMRPMMLAAPGL